MGSVAGVESSHINNTLVSSHQFNFKLNKCDRLQIQTFAACQYSFHPNVLGPWLFLSLCGFPGLDGFSEFNGVKDDDDCLSSWDMSEEAGRIKDG